MTQQIKMSVREGAAVPPCRVLLVGEDNPQSAEPEYALYNWPAGCAGNRLQRLILGIPGADYLALWRTNLCNPAWSLKAARARALDILGDHSAEWSVVVLLGAKVARAAGYPLGPFTTMRAQIDGSVPRILWDRAGEAFEPVAERDKLVVSLPHPSGRNLVWNEPANIRRAQMIMRAAVPEIAWGTC